MHKSLTRLVFALVVLIFSLAALAWSFLPGARIVIRQKIEPTEMQLNAPEGFLPWDKPRVFQDVSPDIAYFRQVSTHFVMIN